MIFDSIEEEERWEQHMSELAKMNREDKRRYSRMLDKRESLVADQSRRNMTINKMATKACTIRDGVVGVRSPYVGNV